MCGHLRKLHTHAHQKSASLCDTKSVCAIRLGESLVCYSPVRPIRVATCVMHIQPAVLAECARIAHEKGLKRIHVCLFEVLHFGWRCFVRSLGVRFSWLVACLQSVDSVNFVRSKRCFILHSDGFYCVSVCVWRRERYMHLAGEGKSACRMCIHSVKVCTLCGVSLFHSLFLSMPFINHRSCEMIYKFSYSRICRTCRLELCEENFSGSSSVERLQTAQTVAPATSCWIEKKRNRKQRAKRFRDTRKTVPDKQIHVSIFVLNLYNLMWPIPSLW